MKRFLALLLVLTLLTVCCIPAYAADSVIISGDFWAETIDHLDNNFPQIPIEPIVENSEIAPRAIVRSVWKYTPSQITKNETAFFLGTATGINALPYQSNVKVVLTLASSQTITTTTTGGLNVGGEVDTIVAKVNAQVTEEIAKSITLTQATTLTGEVSVPPGQTATCDFYNQGYYADGTMSYYVRDTSGAVQYTEDVGVGALVPIVNAFIVMAH